MSIEIVFTFYWLFCQVSVGKVRRCSPIGERAAKLASSWRSSSCASSILTSSLSETAWGFLTLPRGARCKCEIVLISIAVVIDCVISVQLGEIGFDPGWRPGRLTKITFYSSCVSCFVILGACLIRIEFPIEWKLTLCALARKSKVACFCIIDTDLNWLSAIPSLGEFDS